MMDSAAIWNVMDWLGRSSLHAGGLVIVVLLVQAACGRRLPPRWRCALWWLVMLRLLMPALPPARWSALNLLPTAGDSPPLPIDQEARANGAILFVFALWLAGVLVAAGLIALRHRRTRALVATGSPISDETAHALLDECRSNMRVRQRVGLLESPALEAPILAGVLRPQLLLPAGAVRDLQTTGLRDVFLHELAHVRRRDLAVAWLMSVLLVIHWCNPLLWLASRRMRIDRECACDALALDALRADERQTYGRTLLHLLERVMRPALLPRVGAAGVVESRREVERRLRLIARHRRSSRAGAIAGAAVLIMLGAALLTEAPPSAAATATIIVTAAETPARAAFGPVGDAPPAGVIRASERDGGRPAGEPVRATATLRPAGAFGRVSRASPRTDHHRDPP
jgi:bla regulator protein BlaR1